MTDGWTDGRTDRQTELRWLRRTTAVAAVARNKSYQTDNKTDRLLLLT